MSNSHAYGDKRDYPKIDIYVKVGKESIYLATTTWSKTCQQACDMYRKNNPAQKCPDDMFARFQNVKKKRV